MSEIIVEKKSILEIFKNTRLIRVPRYQRSYSWERDQCADMWEDIVISVLDRKSEYFLGTLIFCDIGGDERGKGLELVDGQQRLTTITILLAAMSEALAGCDTDTARRERGSIEDELIKNAYLDGGANKLVLGEVDEEFFKKNIQDKETRGQQKGKRKSEKRIMSALRFFQEKIADLMRERNYSAEELIHRLLHGLKDVSVIKVKVGSESEAYTIFETINARGVDLAVADLLKNYIFSNSYTSKERNQQYWHDMQDSLLDLGLEVSQYIRHFWISKYGKVREKDLYREIKERFQNRENDIANFCEELKVDSDLYIGIVKGSLRGSEKYGDIERYLNIIGKLKLKQCYPLLISLFKTNGDFEKKEEILRKIVKVAIQRGITDKNPNEMEKLYFSVASEMRNGKKTTEEIRDAVKDLEISSGEFAVAFLGDQISPSIAKIILEEMELSLSSFKPEKQIVNLTLEHVLPQTKSEEWGAFSEEEHRRYYERMGNLTLLGREKNAMGSNDGFAKKHTIYKTSEYGITRIMGERYAGWGKSEIDERGKEILRFVVSEIFKERE